MFKRRRCVLLLRRFLTESLTKSTGEEEVKTGGNFSKLMGREMR